MIHGFTPFLLLSAAHLTPKPSTHRDGKMLTAENEKLNPITLRLLNSRPRGSSQEGSAMPSDSVVLTGGRQNWGVSAPRPSLLAPRWSESTASSFRRPAQAELFQFTRPGFCLNSQWGFRSPLGTGALSRPEAPCPGGSFPNIVPSIVHTLRLPLTGRCLALWSSRTCPDPFSCVSVQTQWVNMWLHCRGVSRPLRLASGRCWGLWPSSRLSPGPNHSHFL